MRQCTDNVQTSIIQITGTMWKQIKYFLMITCLETLVKAVWPLSQRPEGVFVSTRRINFCNIFHRICTQLCCDLICCDYIISSWQIHLRYLHIFFRAASYIEWIAQAMDIIQLTWYKDQSRCAPSQWETSLHCNNVFHWLGTYHWWYELKSKSLVSECHFMKIPLLLCVCTILIANILPGIKKILLSTPITF